VCWNVAVQEIFLPSAIFGIRVANEHDNIQLLCTSIKVITKLPNSEQSYKGKVKTHNYKPENCENRNDNTKEFHRILTLIKPEYAIGYLKI
jgi:hypothetical protein